MLYGYVVSILLPLSLVSIILIPYMELYDSPRAVGQCDSAGSTVHLGYCNVATSDSYFLLFFFFSQVTPYVWRFSYIERGCCRSEVFKSDQFSLANALSRSGYAKPFAVMVKIVSGLYKKQKHVRRISEKRQASRFSSP